jgi:serine/threonine protein kinase
MSKYVPFFAYFFHFLHFLFHPCNYYVESEQGIFEQVLSGDLDFSSDPWPSISESAKDLVRRMLVRDPRRRLTAYEVLCESSFVVLFFDQLIQTCRNHLVHS